jgi:hypothetical protein
MRPRRCAMCCRDAIELEHAHGGFRAVKLVRRRAHGREFIDHREPQAIGAHQVAACPS